MPTALSYDISEDAKIVLANIERIEQAITYVRMPFRSQFSFGPYRCRARVLGNANRFAVALTIFAGRVPFTAENRAARKALLELSGLEAANAGTLAIMADNWAIVTARFAVLEEPRREIVCEAILRRLVELRPSLDTIAKITIR
ncbi:MAG: hypothetical protein ACFBZ9_11260 [Sphingomonadales bacterium]